MSILLLPGVVLTPVVLLGVALLVGFAFFMSAKLSGDDATFLMSFLLATLRAEEISLEPSE